MSDLTPPPDEPLPDQSRARIRAELLETAQGSSPARRWLVPVAVAAAIVLVVGAGAWAVRVGGGPDDDAPPVAATSSSTSAPPTVGSTPPTPPSTASSTPPGAGHQVGTGDCEQESENVLRGAQPVASFGDGTSFLVKGDRFVLCDVRGGVTTVHHPLPLTPAEKVETYQVSTSNEVRVAGGVVPDGVMAFDVSYTFPDGETVPAETVRGEDGSTWWRMVHTYAAPGNELKQPPIEVTVSYSGVQKHYTLQWGLDTCAQANHGC